jgi:hypothetical protein
VPAVVKMVVVAIRCLKDMNDVLYRQFGPLALWNYDEISVVKEMVEIFP